MKHRMILVSIISAICVIFIVSTVAVLHSSRSGSGNETMPQTDDFGEIPFTILDQNVEEFSIGNHAARVVSIQSTDGIRYLLAVQEKADSSYRFLAVHYDAGITFGKYSVVPASEAPPYVNMTALFLEDGCLIQVLSDVPYQDTEGGPLYSAETDQIYNADGHEYRYCLIFWINRDLPYDYELYSDSSNTPVITYSTIMNTARSRTD